MDIPEEKLPAIVVAEEHVTEQNQELDESNQEVNEQNQEVNEHNQELEEHIQQEQEHDVEVGRETENSEKRWPGWPGESVFRILVPAQKVGGIIGRKGEFIKKMCEETRARIKILDGPPGAPERAVLSADS